MGTIGFGFCLLISSAVLIYMAFKNYENINIYYWSMVMMIPVIILGYWLKTRVTTPEGAAVAFCFIYLDSTLLLLVLVFSMMYALGLKTNRWIKFFAYLAALLHLAVVWYCFNKNLYYQSITVIQTAAGSVTLVTDGPLKIFHLVYLLIVIPTIAAVLIYSITRHGTYSRRTLYSYGALAAAGIFIYLIESALNVSFTVLPYLYTAGDVLIAIDYEHSQSHDISCIVSEQQKYHDYKGYAAFDLQKYFLNCNQKALEFFPELQKQHIDEKLSPDSPLCEIFYSMIDEYTASGVTSRKFRIEEMTCACDITAFSIRKSGKRQGYLFSLRDATEEQKTLDVMTAYNKTLNEEVQARTQSITDIQQKIVVGMANIIENRDSNTGGHVKRTSDIIRIIVDEIRRQGNIPISDDLAQDIIRAAPMHDLGKVSVDSSILCKPGKLTDEEFTAMKNHSTRSGEMVMLLLNGVENEHFVTIAYHVARFHHERWDGRGYPEGLVGTMIPLEARIMAVADVYDALVSKRCYKPPMNFEKAFQIMCDGMGTQFDPNMKAVFIGCHEKLEAYYKEHMEGT